MQEDGLPITYKTGYRIAGIVMIVFSLPALIPMLDSGAPTGVRVLAGVFWAGVTAVGLFLALRSRRTRWDAQRRAVVEEKGWPWGGWTRQEKPVEHFEEIEVSSMALTDKPGRKGWNSGLLIRARHQTDSPHFLPGEQSWVIWSYTSIKGHREEALAEAERAGAVMGLPVRNRIAE